MAETLGSLVDKLTIKDIREFFLNKMIREKSGEFGPGELKKKLAVLKKQKDSLKVEIDCFIRAAVATGDAAKDEKLKLYNARKDMGLIPTGISLGQAVSGLAVKNLELWNLEDQARRKDVALEYVGGVKRKIDRCNQQRNDYIDKIDELFAQKISAGLKGKAKCR